MKRGLIKSFPTDLPKAASPPHVSPPHLWWQQDWFFGLALFVITTLVYMPVWNGQPIWDDNGHLTKPELQSVAGLKRIWIEPGATQQYYPLVHTFFWIAHRLWGNWPYGYHFLSILLHVLSAMLMLRILRQLEIPGARLATALFALHPIQVESVAWISELKNTLSGVFYLSAGLIYLRFRSQTNGRRQSTLYAFALGLFVLGLLSKSVIATLPAALLVVFWWKRGELSWKGDFIPLIPFFAFGAASGAVTALVERKFIGAEGADFEFSVLERVLIAGRAFWFYLGKLVWPKDLIFIYPRWHINQTVWWQYLFPLAALGLLLALWLLRRRWRGPLAAFLLYGGTLFPALGFVNVYPFLYSFVADHFQYLACVAPLTLAAAVIATSISREN
jgi:protein O-mannosyl-transferase